MFRFQVIRFWVRCSDTHSTRKTHTQDIHAHTQTNTHTHTQRGGGPNPEKWRRVRSPKGGGVWVWEEEERVGGRTTQGLVCVGLALSGTALSVHRLGAVSELYKKYIDNTLSRPHSMNVVEVLLTRQCKSMSWRCVRRKTSDPSHPPECHGCRQH